MASRYAANVADNGAGGGTRTPTGIFSPTDFHTSYGFRRRLPAFVVWTIPSPWQVALGAARLVSTPSLAGLVRDCHVKGFPEFEQFCILGFPKGTQVLA
jgi:hypothetical protein